MVQLDDDSEEEVEKGMGEYEGSLVIKWETLCAKEERGKEGGEVDSLREVMVWLQRTCSG